MLFCGKMWKNEHLLFETFVLQKSLNLNTNPPANWRSSFIFYVIMWCFCEFCLVPDLICASWDSLVCCGDSKVCVSGGPLNSTYRRVNKRAELKRGVKFSHWFDLWSPETQQTPSTTEHTHIATLVLRSQPSLQPLWAIMSVPPQRMSGLSDHPPMVTLSS